MNDTAREYLSYGKFIVPLLRAKKTITPEEIRWGNKNQYFLYFPAQEPRKNKTVIHIHGGGWNSRTPKMDYFVGQSIAAEGYDCFMMDYRKTPKYHYDDIADDVFRGYVEIRKYISEKGLSCGRPIIMGYSAGAHLSAVLCFDKERQKKFNISKDSFSGLLSMAGPLYFGLPQTGTLNTLLKYLFGTKDKTQWEKGEPYRMIHPKENFKLCMIQSKHDGLVGWDQAVEFMNKAEANGISSEIYEVTDAWNTHSAYCVGSFLKKRSESNTLDTVFKMLEKL